MNKAAFNSSDRQVSRILDDGKSGVFDEQLLRAYVAEIDGGLRFIAIAFDVGDGADTETLMFDDIADFQGASRS